jgi:hypothetical protein
MTYFSILRFVKRTQRMKPSIVNDYYTSSDGDGETLETWDHCKSAERTYSSQPPAPRGKNIVPIGGPTPGSPKISQNPL